MNKIKFNAELPAIAQYDYRRTPNDFSCIQELLEFLDNYDTSDCFFRGQSGLWDITSSLYRHLGTENFEKAKNISLASVEWLKKNKYISEVIRDNDDYALAIAQHYGCPTDLVDVTTDIRTAAYFATTKDSDHRNTPDGCIWIFPKSEIERLQNMMRQPPKGLFSSLPKILVDKLIANDYNQLLLLNIPQLSRLNAQKGAFLWDMEGLLKYQLYFGRIGIRFVFKHTEGERNFFAIEAEKLFPSPNQLESEIMRIFTEIKPKRVNDLPEYYGAVNIAVLEKEGVMKNGLLAKIVDSAKGTTVFPWPDFFVPSFGEYQWIKRTITQKDYKLKKINKEECVDCILQLNIDGTLSLVKHIKKSIEDDCLTDLLIVFCAYGKTFAINDGEEQILVDLVVTLNNYLYNDDEIATVILEWIKLRIFIQPFAQKIYNNGMTMEAALIWGYVNDWVAKYYDCRVTKLDLYEGDNYTRFWLPEKYHFLDEKCQNEFSTFDKSCYQFPKVLSSYFEELADNAKIFMYQYQPQKILSYESMKKIFVDLILPQHFAFRHVSNIIYIPDYITKICLPIFGKQMFCTTDDISKDFGNVGSFTII